MDTKKGYYAILGVLPTAEDMASDPLRQKFRAQREKDEERAAQERAYHMARCAPVWVGGARGFAPGPNCR